MADSDPSPPEVVIIAGPNGAGKSTIAPYLLKDTLRIVEFVNADTIARGLCEFAPETVALEAGRIMLERIRDLTLRRRSFAFETTLASRSIAHHCREWTDAGYRINLVFLWLPSPMAAINRVRTRVKMGGHHIDSEVIARRYERGLRNFFGLYRELVHAWRFYNNSSKDGPRMIASSEGVADASLWRRIRKAHDESV